MYYQYLEDNPDHPKRKEMIVRVAQYFNLTNVNEYDLLEKDIRRLYCYYSYRELIRPLVNFDHVKNELSYRCMARKYGVTKDLIVYMLTGRQKKGKI